MNKIFSVLTALLVFTGAYAGQGLVLTQKYTDANNKGANITVTWYITQSQCKLKMAFADDKINTNTYFIPDGGNLLSYSDGVAPGAGQPTYYTIPVQNVKSDIDVSRVTVTKTGETKTISGMVCEKIVVKSNRSTTEMWVTTAFKPDFYKFASFFQNSYELMGLSQESIQGVPLESVTKDLGGNVINSYELVSASNTDLNAAEFTVPAAYKNAADVQAPATK